MNDTRVQKLPYPPLLLRVLRTSAVIWLLVRSAYVLLLLVGMGTSGVVGEGVSAALQPSGLSRILLVALTAVLVWLDRRRAHEHLLPANFGVSPLWFWSASLLAAAVLDLGTHAILGLF